MPIVEHKAIGNIQRFEKSKLWEESKHYGISERSRINVRGVNQLKGRGFFT